MEPLQSAVNDEKSDLTLSTISLKDDQQQSDIVKENLNEENNQDAQSKVTSFIPKRQKIENISDTSSDSDIVEEIEEEINLETCSVRTYIEHTVGRILLTALTILERERPDNPIKWLAQYLLFHKDQPFDVMGEPTEYETLEPIKLPEHVKKVIMEDLQDLEIEAVNKFV